MTLTADALLAIAMANPINEQIAERLPALGLDQCMLTAGCLFQAVWNNQSGLPAAWGVKDYDVFYFDEDVSWEAENQIIEAARALFSDIDAPLEFKNQARVHLWYTQRFGSAYPQLRSTRDGVDRYLIAGTCVALAIDTGEVYAPYGLQDIEQGLLRINPKTQEHRLFAAKAKSYQARWPWLRIIEPGV